MLCDGRAAAQRVESFQAGFLPGAPACLVDGRASNVEGGGLDFLAGPLLLLLQHSALGCSFCFGRLRHVARNGLLTAC